MLGALTCIVRLLDRFRDILWRMPSGECHPESPNWRGGEDCSGEYARNLALEVELSQCWSCGAHYLPFGKSRRGRWYQRLKPDPVGFYGTAKAVPFPILFPHTGSANYSDGNTILGWNNVPATRVAMAIRSRCPWKTLTWRARESSGRLTGRPLRMRAAVASSAVTEGN